MSYYVVGNIPLQFIKNCVSCPFWMAGSTILYVPNIIGYLRIVLLLFSIFTSDVLFICLYSVSVGLDFFDGKAARYFHQTSKLGATLDMVTDRVSTTIILLKIIQDSYRVGGVWTANNKHPNDVMVGCSRCGKKTLQNDQKISVCDNKVVYNGNSTKPTLDKLSGVGICVERTYCHLSTGLTAYILLDLLCNIIYFISMIYKDTHHKLHQNFIMSFYYSPATLYTFCFGSELYFLLRYYLTQKRYSSDGGNENKSGSTQKKMSIVMLKYLLMLLEVIVVSKAIIHLIHGYFGIMNLSEE